MASLVVSKKNNKSSLLINFGNSSIHKLLESIQQKLLFIVARIRWVFIIGLISKIILFRFTTWNRIFFNQHKQFVYVIFLEQYRQCYIYPGHELNQNDVREEMKLLLLRHDKFLLQIYIPMKFLYVPFQNISSLCNNFEMIDILFSTHVFKTKIESKQ